MEHLLIEYDKNLLKNMQDKKVDTCYSRTCEVKEEITEIQGHPLLHSELEVSLVSQNLSKKGRKKKRGSRG